MADPKARPVTLRSIADQLGLHVSTVSRVLNGPSEGGARAASGDTAERIRRLAAELGYQPDPHGSGLRTGRSRLVGVLVPRLSDLVLSTIYEGIDEAAGERGLTTIAANSLDDDETRRTRTKMLLARRVDGLIFGDARLDDAFLDRLATDGVRFVLVNRRAGNHPSVTPDDRLGGRLAAEHLLGLGHTDVAVIAGPPFASTGADRTAGFVGHYREHGIRVPDDRVLHSPFDTSGGRAVADRLLRSPNRPTAIFAVNDFAAIGALGAARDHGLHVGTDIAIMGYNDTPLAAELPIPLTSVAVPMREIGRRALELLTRLLAGENVDSERLRPVLAPRASTGPRRTGP
ncbi:substrate-binding domain-containing protein [Actinoallomurus spadix]|uniref:LacI family DNA-binding transcriptional regulator n=1 Tax=Actinoallomurus spadix TaxID=79912 RepID=A0ABP3GL47_9ACTN|nr:substrate-binding domain-containing protein [Actinoallomurus spadix]MCO5990156.1 substrate-binding domain-containing protein [Actinoallomurus spadix]